MSSVILSGVLLLTYGEANCLGSLLLESGFKGSVFYFPREALGSSSLVLDDAGVLRFDYRGPNPESPGQALPELRELFAEGIKHFEGLGLAIQHVEVEWIPDGDSFTVHEYSDFLARSTSLGDASSAMQTTTGMTLAEFGFDDVYHPEYFYEPGDRQPLHLRRPALIRARFWPRSN